MKITKSYLQQVIKEELERLGEETTLDEAFYQGGGEVGEPAYDDLQASTKSQYGNSPKGDRSAAAVDAYKQQNKRDRFSLKKTFSGQGNSPESSVLLKLQNLNTTLKKYGELDSNQKQDFSDLLNKIDFTKGTIDGLERPFRALTSGGMPALLKAFQEDPTYQKKSNTSGKYAQAQSMRNAKGLRAVANPGHKSAVPAGQEANLEKIRAARTAGK